MDTSWRALSLINSEIRDCHEQLTVYNMFCKLTEVLCLSRVPKWETTCLVCLIQRVLLSVHKKGELPLTPFLIFHSYYREIYQYVSSASSLFYLLRQLVHSNLREMDSITWIIYLKMKMCLLSSPGLSSSRNQVCSWPAKTFLCYTKTEFILSVSMLSWEWVAMYAFSCSVMSDSLWPHGL